MASVGAHLRDLRERRGLSLEEIARATRVATRYLEALESDAFASLPAPVFTRGFIRAYCQALGVPPDDALALFDRGIAPIAPPVVRPAPARPMEREPRTRGAVLVSFVLLVVLGMALFAVTLMIQPRGTERMEPVASVLERTPPREPSVPPAPSAAITPSPAERPAPSAAVTPPAGERPAPSAAVTPPAGVRPAPSAAVTPPSAPAVPPAAPASPAAPAPPAAVSAAVPPAGPPASAELQSALGSVSAPFHLIARTSELTWIRVRTEDGRVSEENVPAGQVREWVSDRPFVLTIGNAGGVAFVLNGRPVPSLGGSGAVISRLVLPPDGR